jgi:Radical SAM superfamily/4Fe-4S single cluster domain
MSGTSTARQAAATRQPEAAPRRIGRLELHVTHACNLVCESCSHYSNHNHHHGHLTLAEADRWMGPWSHRFDVREFHLLGGEPTIHPDLCGFVALVRRHWPKTFIRIRTNGFFLHRHPDLPALLVADGRAVISLAVHHDSPEYHEHLRPTFELIARWHDEFGIETDVDQAHANWTRRYHGFGAAMQPFEDNAPRASWEICPARICKQLFEGKIWKCAPLAYLKMQKAKYALSPKWDYYLGYQALDPLCSDAELDDFIAKEDEPYCGMCSATRRPLALSIPIRGRQNPRAASSSESNSTA